MNANESRIAKHASARRCRDAKEYAILAKKVARALTPTEVPQEVLDERRAICTGCEFAHPLLEKLAWSSQCAVCKCLIHLKTRLREEECPKGKWPALDTPITSHRIGSERQNE